MEELYAKIAATLIKGNLHVKDLAQKALDEQCPPQDILEKGLLAGMDEVGKRFKSDEMFIPEVLRCAKCMHDAMEVLRPLLSESEVTKRGTFVIGTVEGDLHDIGKNLVGMLFESAGFKVIDIGVSVKTNEFIEAVKQYEANVMGMSALLTTTRPKMKETIDAFEAAGLRDQVKIMVGGAPVTEKFAEEIGADGYAPTAIAAVDKAKEILRLA